MEKIFLIFLIDILPQGTAYAAAKTIVTWVDNSDDENGFVLERTVAENCINGWEVIGYTVTDQVFFVDTYLPGACYRVAAYNEHGISPYSNIAQAPGGSEL